MSATNDADPTPPPWEVGAGGRGFLLQLDADPELRLWTIDENGRPFHAEVIELLGLEQDTVLTSLIIEPDGETTVMDPGGAVHGRTNEEWVWALDERLSARRAWHLGWDEG